MVWGSSFGMGSEWLFGALIIVGIVLLAVVVVRQFGGPRDQAKSKAGATGVPGVDKTPRQILDERYAAGDLSTEDYQDRVRVLGSGS